MPRAPDWTAEQHKTARERHNKGIRVKNEQAEKEKQRKVEACNEMERLANELGIKGPLTIIMCERGNGKA